MAALLGTGCGWKSGSQTVLDAYPVMELIIELDNGIKKAASDTQPCTSVRELRPRDKVEGFSEVNKNNIYTRAIEPRSIHKMVESETGIQSPMPCTESTLCGRAHVEKFRHVIGTGEKKVFMQFRKNARNNNPPIFVVICGGGAFGNGGSKIERAKQKEATFVAGPM
jgi:hypothetical protein